MQYEHISSFVYAFEYNMIWFFFMYCIKQEYNYTYCKYEQKLL